MPNTTITVPVSSDKSSTASFVFTTTEGAQTAQSIAGALTGASSLSVTTVSGGGSVPAPGGSGTQELLLTGAPSGPIPGGYNVIVDQGSGGTVTAGNVQILAGTGGGHFNLTGAATIAAAGGSNVVSQTGAGAIAIALDGSGADTIVAGGSGLISDGTGSAVMNLSGNDTVFSNGSDVITATGASSVIGGAGSLTFSGGSGTSTVLGGSGSESLTAGTGGVVFQANTDNNATVNASAGTATVFGAAGRNIFLVGSAGTGPAPSLMISGGGEETLNAAGSSGAVSMAGGGGGDLMIAGSGNDTMFATGSTSMVGGSGSDTFVVPRQSGGAPVDVIINFTGSDNVEFFDFTQSELNAALNNATVGAGGVTLTLADNTSVTFSDLTSASQLNGLTSAVSCFTEGTRILTANGELPVEALRIGDLVVTAFRGVAAVRWVGYRHVDCRRHPSPETVWPVHIAAGAFGPGAPTRDLLLSPDHAVYVDGVLIPIGCLVNGASVARCKLDSVTYYHVELPEHDVIQADGLPCESFLDTGNRTAFANGGVVTDLAPNFTALIWEGLACAELVKHGPLVEQARARLAARADDVPVAFLAGSRV